MAIYYIRCPEDEGDEEKQNVLLDALKLNYEMSIYPAMIVICDSEQLKPLLSGMSEYIEDLVEWVPDRQAEVLEVVQEHEEPEKKTRAKKVMPKEICPECGKMAQVTKKGYCKLCAMRKAREAKKQPATLTEPATSSTISRSSANDIVAGSSVLTAKAGKPVVIFDHNPEHSITRHGPIGGHKLG